MTNKVTEAMVEAALEVWFKSEADHRIAPLMRRAIEAALSLKEEETVGDAPERIRVAQDSDGFWTCRQAISGSQEYVRADLAALAAPVSATTREMAVLECIAKLQQTKNNMSIDYAVRELQSLIGGK